MSHEGLAWPLAAARCGWAKGNEDAMRVGSAFMMLPVQVKQQC